MRQDVKTQFGKLGHLNQTITRCCHKCGEAFWGAVPNLCCLHAENCQTVTQSRTPGLYRDPNFKAGSEKLCWWVCQISGLLTGRSWKIWSQSISWTFESLWNHCKNKIRWLKAILTARNQEAKQLTQLERTHQRNPSDWHVISQAETELRRATVDDIWTTHHLEETIDNFEKQKIKGIKTIFSESITIEMLFHSEAVEVYTDVYQNIQKTNEDLKLFQNSLDPPEDLPCLAVLRYHKNKSKASLQKSLSAKCLSGTGQLSTCQLRNDRQAEDDWWRGGRPTLHKKIKFLKQTLHFHFLS